MCAVGRLIRRILYNLSDKIDGNFNQLTESIIFIMHPPPKKKSVYRVLEYLAYNFLSGTTLISISKISKIMGTPTLFHCLCNMKMPLSKEAMYHIL